MEEENIQTVETLTEKIKELEGIIATHEENTKTLNDRIAELEGDICKKDEDIKTITGERDKIRKDFDTLKQNTTGTPEKHEDLDEAEEADMADLLKTIKNIMF